MTTQTSKTEKPEEDIDGIERAFKSFEALIETLQNVKFPSTLKKNKSKHAGSKNHGKKRNKKRARMAAKSNKINRKRVPNWKY
jgi:hypothetical protein